MFSPDALKGFRDLGEQFMFNEVTIHHRTPYAPDDANPFGDDTVTFETTVLKVKGWVVAKPTSGPAGIDGVQLIQVGLVHVRVPYGTLVSPGDEIDIGDAHYIVEDDTTESDLAVWNDLWLRRRQ